MKRYLILATLVATLLVGWCLFSLFVPIAPQQVFVDFPSRTSARSISETLEHAGVIRSKYAFLLLRLVRGGRLQAGEYRFAGPANILTVYERIHKGDVFKQVVLIPEGFNLFDIARAVELSGLAQASSFVEAARSNVDLINSWAPGAPSLEGFLYPDTYYFSRNTSVRSMQEVMINRFRLAAAKLHLSTNVYRTVTLASLVEKEVRFDSERSVAAGVFVNRLQHGVALQTDPSVIYAALLANHWKGVIRRSDLLFDSPYNTYTHTGLPPGPICSPGMAALTAAMHPAETDAFYFVADVDGHTQFSNSLKEHLAKVSAYRKNVASSSSSTR